MRTPLILLAPLLLAGCVDESASYTIDDNDQALIVHAQQDRFWRDEVTLRVIASRMPDCQRQLALGKVPLADLDIELSSNGDDVYTLRAGGRQWQVETRGCTPLPARAQAAPGQALGAFHLDDRKKLVFDKVETAAR